MRKVCVNREDRNRSGAVLSRSCLRPSGHIVSLVVDDAIGVVLAVMPPGRSECEPVTEEP